MRGQFTTAERKLAWATLTYWRNFAHGDVDANQFGPAWPAFNSSLVSLDLNVPQVNTMQNYHYEQVGIFSSSPSSTCVVTLFCSVSFGIIWVITFNRWEINIILIHHHAGFLGGTLFFVK